MPDDPHERRLADDLASKRNDGWAEELLRDLLKPRRRRTPEWWPTRYSRWERLLYRLRRRWGHKR